MKGQKKGLNDKEKGAVNLLVIVGVAVVAVIVIFIVYFFVLHPSPAKCSDKTCFVQQANECASTNLTLTERYGTVEYSTKDCVFTKTVIKLDDNESQELKKAMEGKSMTCSYTKGNFDPNWVNTLLFGIEKCKGELRNVITKLSLFVE